MVKTVAIQRMINPSSKDENSPIEDLTLGAISSNIDHMFDSMLSETMQDTFKAVLGNIAGQALLNAVTKHTSLKPEEFAPKLDLVDQALGAHMGGKSSKVMERRILRVLNKKMAFSYAGPVTDAFDFANEVKRTREYFLKRKQNENSPHPLE